LTLAEISAVFSGWLDNRLLRPKNIDVSVNRGKMEVGHSGQIFEQIILCCKASWKTA